MEESKKLSKFQKSILRHLFNSEKFTMRMNDLSFKVGEESGRGIWDYHKHLDYLKKEVQEGRMSPSDSIMFAQLSRGKKSRRLEENFVQSMSRSVSRLEKRGLVKRKYGLFNPILVTPNLKRLGIWKDNKKFMEWYSKYQEFEELKAKNLCPKCKTLLDNDGLCYNCMEFYKYAWGKRATHVKLTPLGIEVCKSLSNKRRGE